MKLREDFVTIEIWSCTVIYIHSSRFPTEHCNGSNAEQQSLIIEYIVSHQYALYCVVHIISGLITMNRQRFAFDKVLFGGTVYYSLA